MGGFILKEKFKCLKEDIKRWNKELFGSIDKRIGDLKDKILELEYLDDAFGLEEEEILGRKEANAELFKCLFQRNSLMAQKARSRWLKEGDVNTRFFHRCINFRRKKNELTGLQLQGEWTDDVEKVKKGIREFFKDHYSKG